jgi:hypothetical protein
MSKNSIFGEPQRCLDVASTRLTPTGRHCNYGTQPVLQIRIRGLFDPLDPGSGMGKKSGSGSGMNNPDLISESLETIFWVKIRYGISTVMRIRDPENSGINIPDPQHCTQQVRT